MYINVREHSKGDQHIDVDWSPIIEDLYSLELGFMDICVTNVFSLSTLASQGFRMHPHRSLRTLVDY